MLYSEVTVAERAWEIVTLVKEARGVCLGLLDDEPNLGPFGGWIEFEVLDIEVDRSACFESEVVEEELLAGVFFDVEFLDERRRQRREEDDGENEGNRKGSHRI